MKLKQIVCYKTDLTLTKENKPMSEEEARVNEILAATYKGKPVAELVEEEGTKAEDKPVRKATTRKKTSK